MQVRAYPGAALAVVSLTAAGHRMRIGAGPAVR